MQPHSSNITSETPGENTSDEDIFTIYHLIIRKPTSPITFYITIVDQQVPIDVDTGASKSITNWNTFLELKRKSCLNFPPAETKLRRYSGEIVSPKEKCDIEFVYQRRKCISSFLITE